MRASLICVLAVMTVPRPALAGPPYISDDPEPTDYGHFEIYAFGDGKTTRGGTDGEAGVDFNYGAAPDVQLTAVLPGGFDSPTFGGTTISLGSVELAAKYRFLHQELFGWDVSVFPRVFLPSGARAVGARHASLLLPIWFEKDWGAWSTFGGGGCEINRGGGSQDFCLAGWTLTRQVTPKMQLGMEVYHQTADARDARNTTNIGIGARYDVTDTYHLMAYIAPSVADADAYTWYAALLFTF
jgi:hypothetical protein